MGSALGISTPLTYPTQTMNTGLSTNPFATQQQLLQLLQVVPQQLQHLQQIEYQQQQQIQQIQQVLQVIPIQIAQLQQVIQIALQQIQQQQPLGQLSGGTGLGVAPPWGIAPQFFGAQSGQQVM